MICFATFWHQNSWMNGLSRLQDGHGTPPAQASSPSQPPKAAVSYKKQGLQFKTLKTHHLEHFCRYTTHTSDALEGIQNAADAHNSGGRSGTPSVPASTPIQSPSAAVSAAWPRRIRSTWGPGARRGASAGRYGGQTCQCTSLCARASASSIILRGSLMFAPVQGCI